MPNPTVEVKFELFDQITSGLKKLDESMGGFKKSMVQLSNYIDETGKKFFFMNQLAEGMERFNQSVKQFAAPGADFQQQMADLSAITGMTGTNLDKISESSRQIGKDSGLGASAAAEAYKLLASNIDWTKIGLEGLQALQKDTVTLTHASGIDMATAADVMAGAVNQFGMKATESNRIINVLGAGAKFGAAEIADLGASLKVAGTTAALAGITIEGATGAIEVMSQSMIKGEQAGTYLRNIILKLQTENIPGIDLKTQGLAGSLEALKPKLNDVSWLTKTFGMENVNAAQILISQSGAVKEMTERVTGTNTAMEQAKIRTNTYNYAMMRIKASMDDLKISVFNATGSMLPWVEVLSTGVSGIARTLPGLKVMRDGLLYVGGAMKNGAIGMVKYVSGLSTVKNALVATTVSQRALSLAMKATPWMLIIGLLVTLAVQLANTKQKVDFNTAAWSRLKDSQKGVFDNATEQKESAIQLLKTARDLNASYDDRLAALKKLQDIAPEYFKNFDMETIMTNDAVAALSQYISKLNESATAQALFNEKVKNKQEGIELERKNYAWYDQVWGAKFGYKGKKSRFLGMTGKKDYEKEQNEYYDEYLDKKISESQKSKVTNVDKTKAYNSAAYTELVSSLYSLKQANKITQAEADKIRNNFLKTGKYDLSKYGGSGGGSGSSTLSDPSKNINEVSGKASVKNIYINMDAALKIGSVVHNGQEDLDGFIAKLKTALNLTLNDANYLA